MQQHAKIFQFVAGSEASMSPRRADDSGERLRAGATAGASNDVGPASCRTKRQEGRMKCRRSWRRETGGSWSHLNTRSKTR